MIKNGLKWLLCSLISIIFVYNCIIVDADVTSDLELAKQYEGTFYSYAKSGDWYPFSENGVVLGVAKESQVPNGTEVKYYINQDENYILQYVDINGDKAYAVWRNNTLEELSSSKY